MDKYKKRGKKELTKQEKEEKKAQTEERNKM
jgi:hypothetical protein